MTKEREREIKCYLYQCNKRGWGCCGWVRCMWSCKDSVLGWLGVVLGMVHHICREGDTEVGKEIDLVRKKNKEEEILQRRYFLLFVSISSIPTTHRLTLSSREYESFIPLLSPPRRLFRVCYPWKQKREGIRTPPKTTIINSPRCKNEYLTHTFSPSIFFSCSISLNIFSDVLPLFGLPTLSKTKSMEFPNKRE